ncbi:MAG: hypothetical protein QNJ81_10490 [Acidimicrobiia bacterium]|nr:hypothetical protein [Acidimicrobiia bacterium]
MRRFASLVLVLALFVTACGDDGSEADAPATTAAVDSAAETTEAASAETTGAPATTAAPETTSAPATTAAPAGDGNALLAAIAQSEGATSGRMEGAFVMTGAEGMPAGTEFRIGFSGEFAENGDSSFIMDLSEAANMAPGGEEIPAEFADLFGEMEVRTVGDTAYLRFGMFAMLGVETEWVSMPASDADDTAASFGANPVNPADIMSSFGPGTNEIQDLGRETIRGVDTTHYQVIVDIEAMMAAADEEELEELEGIGASFPTGTMPVDFWVGDDGNVYRFALSFDGTIDPESPFEQMEMVWEMFDYGAPISVTAPPEEDVTDGAAFAGVFTG